MTKFDPNKPVKLRDRSAQVRILATDLQCGCPIVIAVKTPDGAEHTQLRFPDGRCYPNRDDPYDLVNVPEKHELWINLYHTEGVFFGCAYPTREQANEKANIDRIACVRIEFTEGEGL
jgi:hypothetical protein